MALSEFKHLYEILFRFNDQGQAQGAHAQYIEGVKKDGVTIQATPGAAIPLSLVDAADKPTVVGVLGEAALAFVAAKEAADAAVTDAANAAADAITAKAGAESELAQAQIQAEQMRTTITTLTADLEAANLAKSRAEAKVAELLPVAQMVDASLVGL